MYVGITTQGSVWEKRVFRVPWDFGSAAAAGICRYRWTRDVYAIYCTNMQRAQFPRASDPWDQNGKQQLKKGPAHLHKCVGPSLSNLTSRYLPMAPARITPQVRRNPCLRCRVDIPNPLADPRMLFQVQLRYQDRLQQDHKHIHIRRIHTSFLFLLSHGPLAPAW